MPAVGIRERQERYGEPCQEAEQAFLQEGWKTAAWELRLALLGFLPENSPSKGKKDVPRSASWSPRTSGVGAASGTESGARDPV